MRVRICLLIAIFGLLGTDAFARSKKRVHAQDDDASASVAPVSNEIQAKVVQLYSDDQCAEVRKIAPTINLAGLRPNVMAIVAYCEPKDANPEKLFAEAERLSPTGDLILVLHAKYRWKRDPKSSEPLWERVLMVARNEFFREMARDYLSHVIDPGAAETPLDLSSATGFAQVFAGAEHRSEAQLPDFVYLPTQQSYALVGRGDLTFRRWYSFGSLAAHVVTGYERYFSASQFTLWDNSLEAPLAIHVSSNKDVIVRPFTGYSRIGGNPFKFLYGVGVVGAVYRESYTQSVQGMAYSDRIYVPAITSEQGAHYRFEYQWDFYPRNWFLSTQIGLEHVSGTPTSQLFGSTGFFEMSYTSGNIDFRAERDFAKFTIGVAPHVSFRADSQPSSYYSAAIQTVTVKQRHDWDLSTLVDLSVPILPSLQFYAWYELRRIFSNIGPSDYVNRNYSDQTVGAGIKTSLSTY